MTVNEQSAEEDVAELIRLTAAAARVAPCSVGCVDLGGEQHRLAGRPGRVARCWRVGSRSTGRWLRGGRLQEPGRGWSGGELPDPDPQDGRVGRGEAERVLATCLLQALPEPRIPSAALCDLRDVLDRENTGQDIIDPQRSSLCGHGRVPARADPP
jgi:hypothetical protein